MGKPGEDKQARMDGELSDEVVSCVRHKKCLKRIEEETRLVVNLRLTLPSCL